MKKSLKSIGYGLYFLIQIITGLSLPILAILYFLCNQAAMVNLLAILLILIPYIGFFTIITLYYGIMGLSSLIRGRKVENLELFPWEKRLKTSSLIARKQLIVGIVLVIGFLFMTVIDYFQPVSLFTLVIIPLVLVMGGYSLIFFLNFLSFLIQKISIKRNIKQKNWQQISACHLPGSITILFVLLLFIPLAIPTYFLNDPQFSDGLSLQKDLFIG
ncbi:MAG: hypothetical protein ACOC44_06905, partial [Promethearchaeia archaeon]